MGKKLQIIKAKDIAKLTGYSYSYSVKILTDIKKTYNVKRPTIFHLKKYLDVG